MTPFGSCTSSESVKNPVGRFFRGLSSVSTASRFDSLNSISTSAVGDVSPASSSRQSLNDDPSHSAYVNLQHLKREIAQRPLLSLSDFVIGKTVGTGSFGRVCMVELKDVNGLATTSASSAANTSTTSAVKVGNPVSWNRIGSRGGGGGTGGGCNNNSSVASSSTQEFNTKHNSSTSRPIAPSTTRTGSGVVGGPIISPQRKSVILNTSTSTVRNREVRNCLDVYYTNVNYNSNKGAAAGALLSPSHVNSSNTTHIHRRGGGSRMMSSSASSPFSSWMNLPMALKVLNKAKIIRMKQVDHVKDEKRILASLEHPFIVNLLASFQDEQRLYMLMEYVNGGELFSYLRRRGRISIDQSRFYAAEITTAFEYLHERGIVYRDLKPENLLIDSTGHIKIADFGFAKALEDRTWTLCGTHEYLAPETVMRKGHGIPVDWWALGVLLYEMLAGHPPFYDENPIGIYRKILAGKIEFSRHFDASAKSLIKRLLVADPSRRLGCLKDKAEDVKNHNFFKGIDWAICLNRGLTPPYVPNVSGPKDCSMFDDYPESLELNEIGVPPLDKEHQAYFQDF